MVFISQKQISVHSICCFKVATQALSEHEFMLKISGKVKLGLKQK